MMFDAIFTLEPKVCWTRLTSVLRGQTALRLALSVALFFVMHLAVHAATLPSGFSETLVASGLSSPTAMAFAPDGRLFVCQKGGQLRVIKNGALLPTPFLTVSVDAAGERGLLGIAFDPNFLTNNFVYIYYTVNTSPRHNRVSRFTANGDVAQAGSETLILRLNNLSGATNHNGGALHFGPDGKLYIAVGENANRSNSQTLNNFLGKMLRINPDGTFPSDNPFFNTTTGDGRAIWTLGLRNPYTFAFQPGTGRMFINDVGEGTTEEINDGLAGANYGWPACEGACSNPNFRNPVHQYANDGSTCAITGGTFYNPPGNQFPNEFIGTYFFADFCGGWIRRIDPANPSTSIGFATGIDAPVDLKVGPDGNLYYLSLGAGTVFRIRFANAPSMIQFSALNYLAAEGAGHVQITVNRSGDLTNPATVDYTTTDGTASERSDYGALQGTLRFAAGEASKTLTLLLTDDAHVESSETIRFTLTNVTGNGTALGSPNAATVTITDNDTAPSTANPIDAAQFFVRQHYVDFLNREPDAGGLQFWSNQILNCGSDVACLAASRINVSAAFFLSIEFQETSYFTYRTYQAAFGRRVRETVPLTFRESLIGTQEIGRGVIIGQPDAMATLEANKQRFINDFIGRPDFLTAYPANMSPAEFVDKLNANTSHSLSVAERDALVAGLMNNTLNRAGVLRAIVEDDDFESVEFNRAFVLSQYFGYLRRNPYDPPEPGLDFTGYNFWLAKLNEFNGDFIGAEMVKAFLASSEYRQRFGQP